MRAGTLLTSFLRVISLATGPTFGVCFLPSSFALLGIFLVLLFQFLTVFDHMALFLAIIAGGVGRLPSGEKGLGLRD